MEYLRNLRRVTLLVAAVILLIAASAAAAAAAIFGSGTAASSTGWIRLGHLAPNTPAVVVYLSSFGNPDARVVLHDVAYGDASGYLAVPGGEYSVAMRAAGAPATSRPVLTSSPRVSAGSAYTVLAVGLESGLQLKVSRDDLTPPA